MRKLILSLAMCTLAMAETDISGKWVGGQFCVTFKQDGNQLTGTAGPTESEQYPLTNGVMEGDRVAFSVGTYQFDLLLAGGAIKGDVKMGQQTHAVILQRAEALLSGAPWYLRWRTSSPRRPAATGSIP